MEYHGVNELRRMFLDFFESKDHLKMKSFSLVPHNDNSLLIINSGMAPLKPYFTGQEIPPRNRVTTCQKCIRTGDIENIGHDGRHGTFFEMLGNFSFGDYFKPQAIAWAWEFLTKVVELDPERLYPSVYLEDDEAYDIWKNEIGVPEERIYRFGKEDNFWEHGAGPCGPCSEIYYDRGEKYGTGPEDVMGGEGDRFMEVWNVVFSQFNNDGKGNYTELEHKNIDTGMGLERLAVICQDVYSLFDVDTNRAMMDLIGEMCGTTYETDDVKDISFRIIADHVKSCTFMASDGILPSNEGRGYVFRRLLRRAARHGRMLGMPEKFMSKLAQKAIDLSCDGYPELKEKEAMITRVIEQEEERFNQTLNKGLEILEEIEKQMEAERKTVLSGEDAFRLYDTYGFPIDLTKEIMEDKGWTVDEDGFQKAMKVQKDTARGARKTSNYMGRSDIYQQLDASLTTEFVGYDQLESDASATALVINRGNEDDPDDEIVEVLTDGDRGVMITDVTPFYATMGGQEGDTGVIEKDGAEFIVEKTVHLQGGKVAHHGKVVRGMFQTGDRVSLKVDREARSLTARNHSATHLLHAALMEVLGSHVEQAGSLVEAKRCRFDFTHFQAVTAEELKKVEDIVNQKIAEEIPVVTEVLPIEEARKTGAVAQFGEKYGAEVRVVEMGEFSREFCGGTHVKNTGDIQAFHILSESGVAAGVRRIEAQTSKGLFEYYAGLESELHRAAQLLKTAPADVTEKIESLQNEIRELNSENQKLKSEIANASLGSAEDEISEIKGVKFIATAVENVEMNELRNLGDQLRQKIGEGVVVIASKSGDKVNLMATATDGAIAQGAHAGNLIKGIAALVGGGGGGRPNMAQAGGKNPAGIPEALKKAAEVLESQIK
ncbi:alanyl-tRNA synthetase [[Clostridium] aminophilum]|uniref:Alanine--tRNA ligase n=2 Tax=[Clostridium] aminophilum TaxID=1526 RepID=A0A1I0E4T8_9FIRM|nr:alanine--tRNA ligase [[Clostridium] aminophilum]SET40159.1 alanyl-tRNA synthetase [[Clostridium] aminophilum]